jgi:hypothetical protein
MNVLHLGLDGVCCMNAKLSAPVFMTHKESYIQPASADEYLKVDISLCTKLNNNTLILIGQI